MAATDNQAFAKQGNCGPIDEWFAHSALTVLQTLHEGIQFWDESGRLNYANPASGKQFGNENLLRPGTQWLEWLAYCRCHGGLHCSPQEFPVARALHGDPIDEQRPIQVWRDDGSICWVRFHARPRFDAASGRVIGAVSSTIDITELIQQEQYLQHEAHYDRLTRLPNRALFADRIRQAVSRSRRTGELLAVCLMDLDGFKAINDTLGHDAGDLLLKEVARRLLDTVRGDDTAARLGGDEFAILLGGIDDISACEQLLRRLLAAVAAPFSIGGQSVRVSASIGVTLCPGDPSEPEQLMRNADQAMYRAKQGGKNRFDIFNRTLDSKVRANQGLLRKIEQALERGQLCLHFQPKVDCRQGRVVGVEALIRWNHPVLGVLAPAEFIPLIDHDDLIIQVGEWVIGEAMRHLQQLHAAGHRIVVSINIAAYQFLHTQFSKRLEMLLAQYPDSLVRFLEIELLETAALEDIGLVSALIEQHRARGLRFALDDFGTGYSSLAHLKHLPVDVLKIDQTFVRDMLGDTGDLNIVQAVIGLASAFQREVVAEGGESIEHVLMLVALGCDVLQGYVIARPMSAEQLLAWLEAFQPDPRWALADSVYPRQADFQILLLESSHRHNFDRLMGQLARPEPGLKIVEPECRFARWLADPLIRGRHGSERDFLEMEVAHLGFHQALRDCLVQFAEGGVQAADLAHLNQLHERFIMLLNRFRLGLVQGRNFSTSAFNKISERTS